MPEEIKYPKSIYYAPGYDKLYRYILYYYQIHYTEEINPASVLDVGIGNKTVADQLKKHGLKVVTCDYNAELEPDVVGDIRQLPFGDKSFEAVIACEILEHISFKYFDAALAELNRVAKRRVIISLPFCGAIAGFSLYLNLGFYKKRLNFFIRIPFWRKQINYQKNKRHYWELGSRGYSQQRIVSALRKYFIIEKSFYPPFSPHHRFFILKPKHNAKS